MSKIKFTELQAPESQFSQLNERETGSVVGGFSDYYRELRNDIVNNVNVANIVQVNNNVNIQIAFNGDNFNVANLGNSAGATQG